MCEILKFFHISEANCISYALLNSSFYFCKFIKIPFFYFLAESFQMTKKSIRIVFVEDKLEHVQSIQAELIKGGLEIEFIPLQNRVSFVNQMQEGLPDVVLLCYEEGGFASSDCLRLHQQLSPQVPLIVISSSVGEEKAVEIMRGGARDIVLKDKLSRLPASIRQIIKEQEEKCQQEQAEQSLQLSQRHLRNLFRMTPVGVFRCDADKNCFFVNDRYCEITGLSPQQAFGSGWINALHSEDRDFLMREWYNKKGEVEEIKAIFRYLNVKTGQVSWVIGQSASETDSEGRVIGYLGSITDITRLKETEEALKEKNAYLLKVNQELDSFVYSASHNLRAPLTSLMGLINLIRLEKDNPQSLPPICSMMDHSLQRLDGFIRDILDHSRNARLPMKYRQVNLRALLQDILEEFSLQEEYRKLDMQLMVQEDAPLCADASRLRIILRNLLSNCIRYQNRHVAPQVTVTVKVDNENAVIEVSDNGIGIRREHQARVFDMFYRADEQRSGSGLGLYITREAVNRMGGKINLSSEPSQGTEVRIVIPNHTPTDPATDDLAETGPGWFVD